MTLTSKSPCRARSREDWKRFALDSPGAWWTRPHRYNRAGPEVTRTIFIKSLSAEDSVAALVVTDVEQTAPELTD